MSYNKGEKDFGEGPKVHKIRITLTSRDVKALEKVSTELIDRAKAKEVSSPLRTPLVLILLPLHTLPSYASVLRSKLTSHTAPRQGPRPPPNQDPQDLHP
jgi:hypothetical protein